jgi:hypothetical protein
MNILIYLPLQKYYQIKIIYAFDFRKYT